MTSHLYNLVLLSLVALSHEAGICYYCATPFLKSNWYLSGFPRSDAPTGIQFTENCLTPTAENTNSKNCPDMCTEIVFPYENTVQIIRGCYSDLIGSDSFLTVPTADACQYISVSKDPVAKDLSVAATRFCTPDAEECCNNQLTKTSGKESMTILQCTTLTTNCVSCAKYDSKGKCTRSTEAKDQKVSVGNFCKKMEGKLGGHDYVERDAALVAPFIAKDICFDNTSFDVLAIKFGGTNSTLTRAKRDVLQQFKGSVCYCQGAMCNSSHELHTTILPIVTSLMALLSVLPLF